MLSLRNFSWLLGLASVSVTACVVTSEEPGGPDYAHPTEAAFCQALAKAQCTDSAVKACYGSADADVANDKASCVDRRSATSACRASVTGGVEISAPRYNPDQETQKCIDAQGKIYEDARVDRAELDAAVLACLKILSGPGGALATCDNDYECDTTEGLQCVRKAGQLLGTCTVPTAVGGGEDCSDPSAECADATFYCDSAEGGSNACLKAKAAGAVCSGETPCLPELNCAMIDSETGEGTCVDKLANGAVCEVSDPTACKGTFCNAASNQSTGECAASLVLAQTSASCDEF